MFDSDKMLKPRQGTTPTGFGGPGPVNPPADSGPGLPLSLSTLPGSPTVTTITVGTTTFTATLGSDPFPTSDTFLTSSVFTAPDSTTSTPTATTPPPPPPTQSSPVEPASFTFIGPNNATACIPLQIDWKVFNPGSQDLSRSSIDLAVASVDSGNVNMTIATNQPVLKDPFAWSSVSVPPGQYAITGRWADGHGASVQSPVFTVVSGTNTSCLSGAGPTPINTASKPNKGAIAGGTVGGVLLLAIAVVGLFFLCGLRSRSRKRGHGFRRGWGGLGSMDGKTPLPRGVEPGDSNDYLNTGAAAAGRDVPDRVGVRSTSSLDAEKVTPLSTPPHNVSTLDRGAPWAAPTMELAQLPRRESTQNTQDSPRSSLEFPSDLFTTPTSRRASRTPRKPVPAYEPTREELESMAMARSRSDQSHARSSISDSAHHPSSSLSTTSPGTSASFPELRSKSSGLFDGQPVHYLIPDMPPPQPPA